LHFFGARILVQWYCPPAVGYTLAISAIVAALEPTKIKMIIRPYTRVTDPPEAMERAMVAATPAQLLQIFHPAPMIARVPMSREVSDCKLRHARSKLATDPSLLEASVRGQLKVRIKMLFERSLGSNF
jgi:hypothetical protein